MARTSGLLYALAVTTLFYVNQTFAQRSDGQYWPCNPMKNVTCPPNPGLSTYSYTVDFTNPPSDLSNYWTTSNYANITYNTLGNNGAEFTFHKRYDAPQLFTNFYIFFGRVDITMQVAPGQGIISSGVLISDDFDEIDWEMSGNNFAFSQSTVQNNYFSKGITGSYDRGQWVQTPNPQTQFHTYSFDWTPTQLQWLVDGKVVRTFLASQADAGTHQFPQTPSKIQLGLWDGGDPSESGGTISWAGGLTDLNAGPYTMFVKNVSVKNYNPAKFYNWTDQTGSWKSIKPLNTSLPTTSSALATGSTSSAASSTSTSTLPPKAVSISQNGLCGASNPFLCQGSAFGDCCSFYGFCGNSTEYCGNGCQKAFGSCSSSAPTNPISKDARCGPEGRGQTCKGSIFGDCCSRHGWCGGTVRWLPT